MKKRIVTQLACVFILAFLTVSFANASDETEKTQNFEPATKVEKFFSKKGRMFIKNFYEAGIISGLYGSRLEVKAVVAFDPSNESDKTRGLKIEITEGGRIERHNSSFLDVEEVESLVKALEFMISKIDLYGKEDYKDYREVIFNTKDNFNVGFFQRGSTVKKSDIKAFASSGIIAKASSFLSKESLSELKIIIENGLVLAQTK